MRAVLRQTIGALLVAAATLAAPLAAPAAAQQPTTITGRVTSEAGQPLTAATVAIPSLGIGTQTGDGGRYTLLVPGARVQGQRVSLQVRLIGYRQTTREITLSAGSLTEDFALPTSPLRLSEVVVTGAGTLTEAEKLGTARSNVDSTTLLRANEPNVINALAAKAPNVQVLSSSGEAGASSYIRIRGLTSIAQSDGQPLFVIDGMPVDNSTVDTPFSGTNGGTIATNRGFDINPADIENIEILKGASAGAIYGSRAGQGVVLITTKRGHPGQTRYSLHSSSSFDQVGNLPDLQTEYGVGTAGVSPACYTNPTTGCNVGFGSAGSWGPRLTSGQAFDHTDEIFRTGNTFDNTLSISGGTDRTTFYLSAGSLNQKGFIKGPNNKYGRQSVRFNGSQQVTSTLRVGANAAYVASSGDFLQSRNNVSGLLLGLWRTPPDFNNDPYIDPATGLQRSYRYPHPAVGSELETRRYDNALFTVNEPVATADVGRAFGNINAEYYAAPWLRFNYQLGSDFANDERLEALPWTSSSGLIGGKGQVIRGSLRTVQVDHNLTATANYTFSPTWSGNVTVGQNLNSRTFRQTGTQATTLIAPRPFNLFNTTSQNPPNDTRQTIRLESYFMQGTADLYDQLFLTGALRNDGSSAFGQNSRRAWFPKGSVAWSFLREGEGANRWVSFGKARAAYGQSGTQPLPYNLQTPFITTLLPEGGWGPLTAPGVQGVGGLYTTPTLGNPDLGPERVGELEFGADFGLLRDKADLSLTHYRQTTTDAILAFPLPASIGYTAQLRNVGELQNIGYEVALNLRPIKTTNFGWDVGFQWAKNKNEVISMSGAAQVVLNAPFGLGSFPQAVVREGQPLGIWLSDDFVRCGRGLRVEGVDIDNTAGECQGAPAGALYISADNVPIKDTDGQYLVADPNPDWTGGVRSSITWRKLTIGGLLDIRQGGDVWNGTRTALNHFGKTRESVTYREGDQWVFGQNYLPNEKVAGPGAGQPTELGQAWFTNQASVFNGPASFAFEDGSFVKLREISVGYLWNRPYVTNRLGFSSVEFRLAGRNLATWTDYSGVDPETSVVSAQASVVRGVDYFNNPQTRSYVITVTLNR
ncbi:MAG TPA: SusC/RagA family TonB-linked outer membrane protein [Gemmatimonadaceae bacterium]|nr:SusC/RagA family TonB-linked outer membrane protein [Gemmatimonadaceae bacterium]